jgi:CheY-like chemotaxis protein
MSEPRILIVDDNAMNVDLVTFVLNADAMVVEAAADAAQAITKVIAFRPDLVLMDIQMPGMDGLELTRRFKADPATREIAVLAFTAYAMKGDEAKARAAGCDGYLAKPIDVTTFAATVRSYIGAAQRGDGSIQGAG